MDYCLRFDSEQEMKDLFGTYTTPGEFSCEIHPVVQHMALDIVGVIYKPTGEININEEGMEIQVVKPIDGWHVNLRGDFLPESLVSHIVFPNNPTRVWA